MSQVHQRSKRYINIARLVHLRQVHPLEGNLTSVQICAICGRSSPAEGSVRSAYSVGVTLQLRRQGYLRYYLPHSNHLCRSVQSVEGHPQQQFLCKSVKSVGGHPQQAEAIRGSLFAATVSRPITNIACYSVRRTARGQTGADREQTGTGGEYSALLH